MCLTELPPDRQAHPRVLVGGAMERFGREQVHWCEELLAGRASADDRRYPPIEWLGGTEEWKDYWARVWGGRGLLHAGPPARPWVVQAALDDQHWRVREMSLKVIAAYGLDDPGDRVVALLEDDHHRVRAQAVRILREEVTGHEPVPGPTTERTSARTDGGGSHRSEVGRRDGPTGAAVDQR